MTQIKWNIALVLRNQDDFPTQRMGNACLIENVWIPASAIANDNAGAINKRNNILNDCSVFPNVVSPPAPKTYVGASLLYALINCTERSIERHHRGRERRLDALVFGDLEDCRTLAAGSNSTKQKSVKVCVLHSPMIPRKLEI